MLNDILADKKRLFPAGCHTELRAQINRSRSVGILSGNLTGNSRVEVSGVSARVYKNGVWGFCLFDKDLGCWQCFTTTGDHEALWDVAQSMTR